jgi:1,4-alpha-glucan branching enzyme
MKNNRIKSGTQPRAKAVRIEFMHAAANKISVIGTFNGWHPNATPMTRAGEGRWIEVLMLPPGTYEYQFFVDGKSMTDPQAPQTAPNLSGEVNSILTVPARQTEGQQL